ncbi:uncharacterized protein LOC119593269 [Penaeus monodon]|uniref:uncharacterized protein LOC119593269 n=1 Tax=Penaeus monodon TaxID=6687 RepID=UPI0018A7A0DC|nr:uncharacterized protein LOC119593269 [Penaeus monodon]
MLIKTRSSNNFNSAPQEQVVSSQRNTNSTHHHIGAISVGYPPPLMITEDLDVLHLQEAQQKDPDIGHVRWLAESQERPGWTEVAPPSPATKVYCQDWDTIWLEDGILECI